MKIHQKKKEYRKAIKAMAKDGYMNNASGQMQKRSGFPDSSMKRDYHPQGA